MDISQVTSILPQKPPFLMVDKILELIPGKKAVGIKLLGSNEPCLSGHFPGNPIMPGVMQIEAINQVAEYAVFCDAQFAGKLAFITGCDNVKFKRPAVPGDVMVITAEILDSESRFGSAKGKIEVDGQITCEADISFYIQK